MAFFANLFLSRHDFEDISKSIIVYYIDKGNAKVDAGNVIRAFEAASFYNRDNDNQVCQEGSHRLWLFKW